MAKMLTFALFSLFLYTFTTALNRSCSTEDSLKMITVRYCTIGIPNKKLHTELEEFASSDDIKLLTLFLEFSPNTTSAILSKSERSLKKSRNSSTYFYTPFEWFITTSRLGQKLINLKPNYETLSLNTLTLKTEVLYIGIRDTPEGCLKNLSLRNYLFLVREFLMKFLKTPSEQSLIQNRVCTSIMKAARGYAKFSSICYERRHGGNCIYLETDRWSLYLQGFIQFIKLLAILFCPLLIPKKVYQLNNVQKSCALKMRQDISFKVKLSKEKHVPKDSEWGISLPLSHFHEWKQFKPTQLSTDIEYIMDLKELYVCIEDNLLISSSYIPNGLVNVLLRNIYYCELREFSGFALCCSSSVCPQRVQSNCCYSSPGISWFRCCKIFMKIIVFLLCPLPWLLRLMIYDHYEKDNFTIRQSVADACGVRLRFEGYLLGYLSPINWIFLSMYIIYGIDLLVFGTFAHKIMHRIKIMIKQCILDMHYGWTFKVVNWSVNLFWGPFTLFGIVGFFLAPFYWIFVIPIICLTMCFYYIPLMNLLFRFLLHIIWFCVPNRVLNAKKVFCLEHVSRKMVQLRHQIDLEHLYPDHKIVNRENLSTSFFRRQLHMLMALLCLLTLGAIAILLTECVGYVIEIISFTLIGAILHTDVVLPVVSFVFLIIIYFVRSINKVRLNYLDFNNMIVNEIIKSVGKYDSKSCANTAHFSANGRLDSFRFSKSNGLMCRVFSLLLFLDANERPLVPSEFFYKACEMAIPNLPGSLSKNLLKAFLNFFLILLFLIFVTIVVMTFGEIHSVSSANQMLATLAGGILPWFLEKIMDVEGGHKEINTDSVNFQNTFQKTVDEFAQRWKMLDIMGDLRPLNESTETGDDDNTENVTVHILDCDEIDSANEQRKNLKNLYVHLSKPTVREIQQSNSHNTSLKESSSKEDIFIEVGHHTSSSDNKPN